jgi:hypothetical protein
MLLNDRRLSAGTDQFSGQTSPKQASRQAGKQASRQAGKQLWATNSSCQLPDSSNSRFFIFFSFFNSDGQSVLEQVRLYLSKNRRSWDILVPSPAFLLRALPVSPQGDAYHKPTALRGRLTTRRNFKRKGRSLSG